MRFFCWARKIKLTLDVKCTFTIQDNPHYSSEFTLNQIYRSIEDLQVACTQIFTKIEQNRFFITDHFVKDGNKINVYLIFTLHGKYNDTLVQDVGNSIDDLNTAICNLAVSINHPRIPSNRPQPDV